MHAYNPITVNDVFFNLPHSFYAFSIHTIHLEEIHVKA